MDRFLMKKKSCVDEIISEPESKCGILNRSSPSSEFEIAASDNSSSDCDSEKTSTDTSSVYRTNLVKRKKLYKQKYRTDWTSRFGTWLTKTSDDYSFCNACKKPIIGGITHITRHSATILHKNNLLKITNTPKIKTFILNPKKQALQTEIKSSELKMIMFLHEHNLPFLLMDHLPKLINSICHDSEIAKGLKCSRTKATAITKECLAVEALKSISSKLKNSYYSLIIDETTDVGTQKSLAIVVRFYDEGVKDKFLGLVRVKSSTAGDLFMAINKYLENSGIPIMNLIGLAADNAAVMMGNISGVQARFREIVPNIFVMGCACHSFHLCSSAAANKLPKSIEEFARSIYNYFSNSSKRLEELAECQNFVGCKPHKMLRPSQTRWLSLQAVVERILQSWDALILIFTNAAMLDNLHSSEVILNNLKNPVYKLYFYFLSYILDIISRLNLEFQSETTRIHLLLPRVSELYKSILKNFMEKKSIENIPLKDIIINNPHNYLPLDKIYFGAKVEILLNSKNIDKSEVRNFKLRGLEFYIELSIQIKKRFKFDDPFLNFITNFDPKITSSGEIPSIVAINQYFPQLIDNIETLNTEWRLLPYLKEVTDNKHKSFEEFWTYIFQMENELGQPMFPNISKLLKGLMSLPHSSAAAERIFSQLNLMKTKTRNRLEVDTCDAILHSKELMNKNTCYTWTPSVNLLQLNCSYN